MRYGSLCSGIEAATVAWEALGWEPVWFAEIEAFPSEVLQYHYPSVPNLGDITADDFIDRAKEQGDIDVLVGGSPCQSFSVAGLRQSLADDRGNLSLRFVEIMYALRPTVTLWENVPGVLSTKDNAFGCFLAAMVGADGPLVPPEKRGKRRWTNAGVVSGPEGRAAWRILDAQYFRVPQRRRRVFVVRCAGNGPDPVEILFESTRLLRHTPPRREAREDTASSIAASAGHHGRSSSRGDGSDNLIVGTVTARKGRNGGISNDDVDAHHLVVSNSGSETWTVGGARLGAHPGRINDSLVCVNARETPVSSGSDTLPLGAQDRGHAVVFTQNTRDEVRYIAGDGQLAGVLSAEAGMKQQNYVAFEPRCARNGRGMPSDVVPPLKAQSGLTGKGDAAPCVATSLQVRRLTPTECLRLQGFPDHWTKIPWRDKPAEDCPDGPQYRAVGNSMAVPVIRWIGHRIQAAMEAYLETPTP